MSKKSPEIKINPELLKALREASGYTIEEVAKKLKTSPEKVKKTEENLASFTLKQIKKLADFYKRPLAIFFSDTLPQTPKITDFRINREKKLSPEIFAAQRRAIYIANKLAELSGKKSLIPNFPDSLKPDELAEEFRKYLKIELLKSKKTSDLLNYYKQLLEEKLLVSIIELPFKKSRKKNTEKDSDVRGFNIQGDIWIIVLNEDDKPEIKLFSLFHEIYHILKKNAGICSIDLEQKNDSFERECDLFAAEFLVPINDLKNECKNYPRLDNQAISELVKKYAVSYQVIMLRLLKLGLITKKQYNDFKRKYIDKTKENAGKQFGRRNWDKVFRNRVGNLVISEINKAYGSGKIAYSDVFDILNMKTKYIENIINR